MCKPSLSFCDGDTAHIGSLTACNPNTGECEPTTVAAPKDCTAIGEICFDGECVPADSDLCALAQCDGSPAYCSGDTAIGATTEWCEPTTGECTALPGVFVQECADLGLICEDGHCIYDPCAGLACGDLCAPCDPNDEDCVAIGAITTCDAVGECVAEDTSESCDTNPTCTDAECGPMPGMPNYICADGVTVAGPGDCEPQTGGACGWTIVSCPEDDDTCTPGESFEHADGCNNCICGDSGLKAEAICTKIACGCSGPDDCTETYFCDFGSDDCGAWGNGGICTERPQTCVAGGPGACGCGGGSATNGCELNAAGQDVFQYGGCSMDLGDTFLCGEVTCSATTEYCAISMNDVVGPMEPVFYNNCVQLIDECAQGDCSCMLIDEWSTCYDANGYTFVFYPGG